ILNVASAYSHQATPPQAKLAFDEARARWSANPIPYYRLRVASFNPLYRSVADSDVRNGTVLAARKSSGMPGIGAEPGTNWGSFEGQTVETLFQIIEHALNGPDVVNVTYDAGRGYPRQIHMGPSDPRVMDANVSIEITLTESPATPLVAPAPGEAYASPLA